MTTLFLSVLKVLREVSN